jgi:glycerophosphoryl diester phosphodiesterase
MSGTDYMLTNHFVAHRGYPLRFPENTLPSVNAALQAGALFVEVDVQLTRDRIPVVFHYRNHLRMFEQHGSVRDYSLQQLKSFPVSDRERFGDQFDDIFIPALSELVKLVQDWPTVTLFVELKRNSLQQFGIETVLTAVLPVLAPIKARCVIISYAIDALQQVSNTSDFPVGAVFDNWTDHVRPEIQALAPAYLFCDIDTLPTGSIPVPAGCHLVVYECTDPQQARSVLLRGVALVETFAIGEMLSLPEPSGGPFGV